jgi:hypothetical protein
MKAHGASRRSGSRRRSALTLLELVVVMVVLVALAGIVVPMFDNVNTLSQATATNESLRRLQDVIVNRYVPDMKGADISYGQYASAGLTTPAINPDGLPRGLAGTAISFQPSLVWLFQNPASSFGTGTAALAPTFNHTSRMGWNGPYLTSGIGVYPGLNANATSNGFNSTYGTAGDPTVLDAWGNPIVIVYVYDPNQQSPYQYYFVLLSAGPNLSLLEKGTGTAFTETGTGTPALTVYTTTSSAGVTARYLSPDGGTTQYYHWLPLVYYPYQS